MTARREVEVGVRVPNNEAGMLGVLTFLNAHEIPVLTRSCYCDREGMVLMITTSQPENALRLLREAGYTCQSRPVVVVGPTPRRPHVAAQLCGGLREHHIQVLSSYVSSTDNEQAFVVLNTSDDQDALEWLSQPGVLRLA